MRCAVCGSFQKFGSSASLFSSESRLRALSTSKMPPQQSQGLLDVVDQSLNFRAHGLTRWIRGRNLAHDPEKWDPVFGKKIMRGEQIWRSRATTRR
jgi:hypothetical protein